MSELQPILDRLQVLEQKCATYEKALQQHRNFVNTTIANERRANEKHNELVNVVDDAIAKTSDLEDIIEELIEDV